MTKENIVNPSNNTQPELDLNRNKANYLFPFIEGKNDALSSSRDIFLKLAGPDNTIPHAEKALLDLDINRKITITRLIPSQDQQWRIIPSMGIACRAVSPNAIELLFDPHNPNTINSLAVWSGRQIAHELNHIARMERNINIHETLLDALISEGLGVYYEEHWGEYKESHWGHVLSREELKKEWKKAERELYSKKFDYSDWFYGENNGHKIYSGYSLGNSIISELHKLHPDLPMSIAVRMKSKNLLEKSNYPASFEGLYSL